jgi:hypothetical protein
MKDFKTATSTPSALHDSNSPAPARLVRDLIEPRCVGAKADQPPILYQVDKVTWETYKVRGGQKRHAESGEIFCGGAKKRNACREGTRE